MVSRFLERSIRIKSFLLCVVLVVVVALVACSRSSAQLPVSDEPVFAKVIVTDVVLSEDESQVESITVRIDDGDEVQMRMDDDIDLTLWGPRHLLGHVQAGTLGITIGVTYVVTSEGVIAIEFSE